MTLKELVKLIKLEKHERIVVSGPQFSGATIASYILAEKLGLKFVRNSSFDRVDLKKLVKLSRQLPKYCIPCTAMLHNIHSLPSDMFIIIMNRPLESIMESQRRLGWEKELETKHYYRGYPFYDDSNPSAYLQYKYTDRILSRDRRIEYLDYDSMEDHRLFIPNKLDRRSFKRGQIFKNSETPVEKDFTKKNK